MNRNLTYLFTLIVFFFLWGVFGFAAAAPGSGTLLQSDTSSVDQAPVNPDTRTNPPLIPVTGDTQPEPVLFVYGLTGLLTLT